MEEAGNKIPLPPLVFLWLRKLVEADSYTKLLKDVDIEIIQGVRH